jgi:chromosome segregation ATPase
MSKLTRQSSAAVDRDDESVDSADRVSLDVLCRRADRLIDSVRMMGEQVNQMFARPDQAVARASETSQALNELRKQVDAQLGETRRTQEGLATRMHDLQATLANVQESAAGLVKRVQRARELSDAFGRLMDASADKIAKLESAADQGRQVREAIGSAVAEMNRVQQVANTWTTSVTGLASRYADLIASGNTAASRLRTLTDAGDRLRESVREDIVALRELLRESRIERVAWEQLLARIPAGLPAIAAGSEVLAEGAAAAKPSVAAALAGRVRKIADFVRQSAGKDPGTPAPSHNRLSGQSTRDLTHAGKL